MPVKCKLLNKKYRIVGPDGKIETNETGTAVDGKGHDSLESCQKQMTAINLSLLRKKGRDVPPEPKTASVVMYEGQLPLATSSEEADIQRFKKDMIRVGEYTHPVHKWKLTVTPERMQRWLTNFFAMREHGIDVEVPLDHSLSAERNLGYVIDAMIEPDSKNVSTLFGIIEVRGKNSIDIIRRNKNASLWIAPEYKDGEGNYYGEVIKHCAVVQQPVIPGQEDFIPIAASEKGISIFYQGSTGMTKEQLEQLRKLFGLGEDAKEENIFSLIGTHNKDLTTKMEKLQETNLSLRSQLPKDKAASIEPNTLELAASTMDSRIKLLTDRGNIVPAVGKKLAAILVGEQGSRNAYTLSLGDKASPSITTLVIDALEGNDPVKIGEHTKAQVVLGRELPGEDKVAAKEGEDAMACGAGVEEKAKT